ncbi:hypothetical protein SAMN06264365_11285 [Actinoplanes regularis]|uniref:Uncharacterized protein n=2 Tax=Actinoplanes regularis TaxID=52697 RepID=A0A239CTF2_9ACTN|nr:hypothetical protein SAMN06264365_11285 [Actinoplanes regularis]
MNAAKPTGFRRTRWGMWVTGTLLVAAVMLLATLPLAALSATTLPWGRLADVGDALGGVSAALSALALSGVGASLLFQQRQIRQELTALDRQQHLELLKLAIDHPELLEVFDSHMATNEYARHEIYANLNMSYWMTIWQLGEIDDGELRRLAARLFQSEISRRWWGRIGATWTGTRNRPQRRRFLEIVTAEYQAAVAAGDTPAMPVARASRAARGTALTISGLVLVAATVVISRGRRRPALRPYSSSGRVSPSPRTNRRH